jgi:hypothetical protein
MRKESTDCAVGTCLFDHERGVGADIAANPWQTDTCIGQWHYKRGQHYKTAKRVIDLLVDIVRKNGNLLLNFPLPNSGELDSSESGRPYWRDSLQADYLKPAGLRIEIPDLGWHSFRHTYRHMMKQMNASPEVQQQLMRHSGHPHDDGVWSGPGHGDAETHERRFSQSASSQVVENREDGRVDFNRITTGTEKPSRCGLRRAFLISL